MTEDNQDVTFQKIIGKYLKDDPPSFIEQAFKNTCRNKSLSDNKLKVLKDELGKNIVVQVEKADRRKPILLVGSNDALVKGILALIWNTHPLIPKGKPLPGSGNDRVYFVDKNCSGMTEDEIGKDLFYPPEKRPDENDLAEVMHQRTLSKRKMSECLKPLMNLYNNLCILSLRGLEGKQHENILKRIIAEVEERKGNNEEGCLIVSIDGINTLPQEILRQFDPIYLEPKKQNTPASTPQDTAKVQGITTFPLPPGAKVSDIKMVFLNDKNVRVTIGEKSQPFNYMQMGFSHKQNGNPTVLWDTLFEYAECNGTLGNSKKQKRSERIDEKLQKFFETNENLITGNQAIFSISKKLNQSKKPPNIQSKECPKCKETHKHYCFVCNDETEDCKDCHNELYKEIHNEPSERNLSR